MSIRCLLCLLIAFSLAIPTCWGIDEFEDLKTISVIPLTNRELERAFSRSAAERCELIPEGKPIELSSYTTYLTERDRRQRDRRRPIPATRKSVFSVGLEFESRDKTALPSLSRSQIVDYVDKHCVMIQARIRRDLLDRKLYYHHRPLAVTKKYRGVRLSQSFEGIVATTIRDFHGLGLFVPENTRILKPEFLRTLVLLFKSEMLSPGSFRSRDAYEFAFVHGVEEGGKLEPHVFVSTNGRQALTYLRSTVSQPSSSRQTSILGRTRVTDFDSTGLYPKKSAVRSYRLQAAAKYEWGDLDRFCESKRLKGDFSKNVPAVLAAIIEGRFPAEPE